MSTQLRCSGAKVTVVGEKALASDRHVAHCKDRGALLICRACYTSHARLNQSRTGAGALGIGADLHSPLCLVLLTCQVPVVRQKSVLICRFRPRQGGSTGWLLSRHPSLQPRQWRVAACHREDVQSATPIPLLPQQLPLRRRKDANTRSNPHLAFPAQLHHPANMQIGA